MVKGESTTGGKSKTVVVHRRHASRVASWAQGACSRSTLKVGKTGRTHKDVHMSFASMYLPHAGRSSDLWDDAIREVQTMVLDTLKHGDIFLVGDFNTAELCIVCGDEEKVVKQSSGRAGAEAFLRAQQVCQMMDEDGLISLTTAGGHRPTHFPYNGAQPRTFYSQLISKHILQEYECTASILDFASATDHRAMFHTGENNQERSSAIESPHFREYMPGVNGVDGTS